MLDPVHEQLVELGNALRTARIRAERTRDEVAREAAVPPRLVTRIEKGLDAEVTTYLAIAHALDSRVTLATGAPAADDALEEARRKSDKYLKIILDNLFSYVALLDLDGRVQEVNKAPLLRAGYRYEDVVGSYFYDAPWWSYDRAVQDQLKQAIYAARNGQTSRYDVVVKMGDELLPIDFQISPVYDRDSNIFALLPTAVDISERKKIEQEINALAYLDSLTGLPNRRLFQDRLEQEIKKTKRDKTSTVLMLIDLDRFKEVNDTLGHDVGDALLKTAASRIRACVREYDTVARMGGDEFTVILSEISNLSAIQRIAQDIINTLSEEFVILDKNVFVSASVGVAVCPDDASDSSSLIKFADQAMYQAKNDGRGRFHFFTKRMQEASEAKSLLASELRRALPRGQLSVYYQPIIELSTGLIRKAEALLRWNHPEHGLIPPASFIPVAEEIGAIHPIGDWVFDQAARRAKRWCEIMGPEFQICVNKSPVQFKGAALGFGMWVEKLRKIGLPGKNVVVEITENLMLDEDPEYTDRLRQYRDAGIHIAIDDFGTGYSALSYLRKTDVDYLKIDQSFTGELDTDATSLALSEAILTMAHKLGRQVIAEGVERESQRDVLREIGCDYAQGYLFSPAVPADEFEALLIDQVEQMSGRR